MKPKNNVTKKQKLIKHRAQRIEKTIADIASIKQEMLECQDRKSLFCESCKFHPEAENDSPSCGWFRVIYNLVLADIADSVKHHYNSKYPNDSRINDCIQAIRDYHDGLISDEALRRYRSTVYADAAEAAYTAQWKKNEEILRRHL